MNWCAARPSHQRRALTRQWPVPRWCRHRGHGLLVRVQVLRRPHEFKIRALEDIRALFPPTWNPFFCGLGNRDTDEISYLTVGVPPSKIFIINPKGTPPAAQGNARPRRLILLAWLQHTQ